ncbi:hypothetical protein OH76DRAFT_1180322 [Lentinus brumalis]|uniref:Uncharacterized protein n=1 Tax=Lentinus brumalis TaxID=2498619 RepID=A0A371CTS1_9APHY|nr:hypothetical protein OH76DRAFT_1180322 [Polyporus brumalis]
MLRPLPISLRQGARRAVSAADSYTVVPVPTFWTREDTTPKKQSSRVVVGQGRLIPSYKMPAKQYIVILPLVVARTPARAQARTRSRHVHRHLGRDVGPFKTKIRGWKRHARVLSEKEKTPALIWPHMLRSFITSCGTKRSAPTVPPSSCRTLQARQFRLVPS